MSPLTPRCAAFHTGRGGAQSGAQRRAHRRQLLSPHRLPVRPVNMGLEKEKSDTSIIMDEDEFNRSIEPILSKKGKVYTAAPDRDPNDINAHLKVKAEYCAEWLFESETTRVSGCQDELSTVTTTVTLLFSRNELLKIDNLQREYLEVAARLPARPPITCRHLPAGVPCVFQSFFQR